MLEIVGTCVDCLPTSGPLVANLVLASAVLSFAILRGATRPVNRLARQSMRRQSLEKAE